MPQISSLSFNVSFEAHNPNRVGLSNTTPSLPAGFVGIFKVTQPDGYVRNGDIDNPDVTNLVSSCYVTLVPDSAGQLQQGQYTIEFIGNAPGYLSTSFIRTFTLQYTAASISLRNDFDVFTPHLAYTDISNYNVSGYTIASGPTRNWTATSATTGAITSTNSSIDIKKNNQYYAETYVIQFGVTVSYLSQAYPWLTLSHTRSQSTTVTACVPKSLEDLTQLIEALREESNASCGGDWARFEKANSLYVHLINMLRLVLIAGQHQDGFFDVYQQLLSYLQNGSVACDSIGQVIPPYDFSDYESSIYDGQASYCQLVGDGVNTVYRVNHQLGDECVVVQVYEVATGKQVFCDLAVSTINSIDITFYEPPTLNQYRVVAVAGAIGIRGQGFQPGGLTGQLLRKRTNADFDTEWADVTVALPYLVPYTGATQSVYLGEYGVEAGFVRFDTTPTATPAVPAVMSWNDADGTVDLKLKGNNVSLQVGQEMVARVVNKTGANLLESQYKAVRIRKVSEGGAQGQRLAVVLAQANTEFASTDMLGIVTENITNNEEGFITTFGTVRGINTTGSLQGETWADGDILFLSPTVPGGLTKVKPSAPNHLSIVGYVEYAHQNNGKIFVHVQTSWELDELHNVAISSPTSGQVLKYNGTLWENAAIPAVTSVGLATTTPGVTITDTPVTGSGVININIATASASSNGLLSSADWATFNAKQSALTFGNISTATSGVTITNGNASTVGPNVSISIATAASGQNGLLSASDWATFNAKVGGSGTSNILTKFITASTVGDSQIFDNGTNVGISNTAPESKLHVGNISGNVTTPTAIQLDNTYRTAGDAFDKLKLYLYKSATETYGLGLGGVADLQYWAGSSSSGVHRFFTSQTERLRIFANGRIGINTTTDAGYQLDVAGSVRNTTGANFATSSGSVGIGTASPLRTLHIYRAGVATELFLESDAAAQAAYYLKNTSNAIYAPAGSTGEIRMFVNGADRMTFGSGGNVGVGTTSPNTRLSVVGNVDFRNVSAGLGTNYGIELSTNSSTPRISLVDNGVYAGEFFSSAAVVGLKNVSNNPLTFGTNNTERLRITASGQVAINTQSPDVGTILHAARGSNGTVATFGIQGLTINPRIRIDASETNNTVSFNTNYNGAVSPAITFLTTEVERLRISSAGVITVANLAGSGARVVVADASGNLSATTLSSSVTTGSGTTNYITKWTGASTQGDSQIFDNGTRVGIGTASPAARLDIRGSGLQDLYFISTTVTNVENTIQSYYNNGGAWADLSTKSQNLIFNTGPLGGPQAERLRITSGGNVGIGTTSPVTKFHISESNSGNYASVILLSNSADTAADRTGIYGSPSPGAAAPYRGGITFHPGASGAMSFHTGLNNSPADGTRMYIQSNGRIGINTTTDAGYQLDINGTLRSVNGANFATNGTSHIGMGTVPSAWSWPNGVTQFRFGGHIAVADNSFLQLGTNSYYDGSNYVRVNAGYASRYLQNDGGHFWSTAITSTAGSTVTFNEQMRMTRDGELLINTTSDAGDYKLQVAGNIYGSGLAAIGNVITNTNAPFVTGGNIYTNGQSLAIGTQGSNLFGIFTSNTARMYIFSNGRVVINTTTDSGYQFDVNGSVRGQSDAALATGSGNVFVGSTTAAISNGVKYLYAEGGSAGIGPELILHNTVAQDTASMAVSFTGVRSGAGVASQIRSTRRGVLTFHTQDLPSATPNTPAERARITAAGEFTVGFGTTQVVGFTTGAAMRATNTTNTNGFDVGLLGGPSFADAYIFQRAGASMVFGTANAERMRIDASGNVGIGAQPLNRLHVEFTSATAYTPSNTLTTAPIAYFYNSSSADTAVASTIRLDAGNLTGNNATTISAVRTGNADSALTFGTRSGGGSVTERVRVTSTGNLGIGTASPTLENNVAVTELTVAKSGNVPANIATLNLQGDRTLDAGNTSRVGTINFWQTSTAIARINGLRAGADNSGALDFLTNSSGVGLTSRLYIHPNGRVGINTTTDAGYQFDVNGNTRVTGKIDISANDSFGLNIVRPGTSAIAAQIYNNGGANGWMLYGVESSAGGVIFSGTEAYASVIGSYNNYSLQMVTNNTVRMTVTGGGSVGIGVASPSASAVLQVDSTTKGMLPPRMTTTQRDAITSPATGLIVYDTTVNKISVYNGTSWRYAQYE